MSREIKQLATGEMFKFHIPLAKVSEEDGEWFVEGVASDTGLDLHGERISVQGQESMAQWAKSGTVALGGEADHFKVAFNDDMGYLVDGRVSDSGEFLIKAQLDKDMSKARDLVAAIDKKDKKLGLSVFGRITDFAKEDGTNVINGVELTRVMVTTSPANPRTWLGDVAKSLDVEDQDSIALETVPDDAPDNAGESDDSEPIVAKSAVDLRDLAKGMFMEALRQQQDAQADYAPLGEEMARVDEINNLTWILWDVANAIDWAQYDGVLSGEEAADLLRESIGEYKAEIAAKSQPEQVENDGAAQADTVVKKSKGQTEEPSLEENKEGTMSQKGKSLSEIADIFADDVTKDKAGDTVSSQVAPDASHPAVKAGNQLATVIAGIVANKDLTLDQQRQAIALAMAGTTDKMEEALPIPQPADALGDDAPNWAKALINEVSVLKSTVEQNRVNVGAGSPETADSPTTVVIAPERKSQPSTVLASTAVQQPQTMRAIAVKILGLGTGEPDVLP